MCGIIFFLSIIESVEETKVTSKAKKAHSPVRGGQHIGLIQYYI